MSKENTKPREFPSILLMAVDGEDALKKLVSNWGEEPCAHLYNDEYLINFHFCTTSEMHNLIELGQAVVNIEDTKL